MGTSNFGFKNVLYAITETSFEDEETGEQVEDECIYENTVSNIKYELKNFDDFIVDDSIRLDMEGLSIGKFENYIDFLGEEVVVTVVACVRSGYYAGFSFDYEVNVEWDYNETDNGEDLVDSMIYDGIEYQGLLISKQKHLVKRIDDCIKSCHDRLCTTYSEYSDCLVVTARFSNGETFYEKSA